MKMDIAGNPIEKYRIVTSREANSAIFGAAEALRRQLLEACGAELEIVNDLTEPTELEILLGSTNRVESEGFYGIGAIYGPEASTQGDLTAYSAKMVGTKLVFASAITLGVRAAVENFIDAYLRDKLIGNVSISPKFSVVGSAQSYTSNKPRNRWIEHKNAEKPAVLNDLLTDEGYFTEEDGKAIWSLSEGLLSVEHANEFALTYVHIYEYNAALAADFTFDGAESGAIAGITLRYAAEHSYIRVGYDFGRGEWYIDTREGYDFEPYRVAKKSGEVISGLVYRLAARADGNRLTLSVNGDELLATDVNTQLTHGRVGFYARGTGVRVENSELTLLSSEGRVFRHVSHTVVGKERDTFCEGASVLEMNDGSLILTRNSNFNYTSRDGGVTWQSRGEWTSYATGHPSILRLADGRWIKLNVKSIGGVDYMISETSSDDGETWVEGGAICPRVGVETGKPIGNMNDMLTQVRSGRIFASMTYTSAVNIEKWYNFVVFYCSDDGGLTWHRSLDSRYIEGHDVEKTPVLSRYFAESRVIQCADGRIRMLNSWNNYGCFVYCDSFDDGETWGPLQKIEWMTCNRSSFAFARDRQAGNDTTYYMVWCYDLPAPSPTPLPRSRFAIARSEDGMNWQLLGDVWRWESSHCVGPYPADGKNTHLNHIVDPAIAITDDRIIVASGISEYCTGNHRHYHNVQLQHVWTFDKSNF